MPYSFNPFTGNFDNTPSVPEVEGVYLPLSGGTIEELTVVGSISASDQIYVAEHQVIKTNTTDFPGTSAVTKIIAVSALPVSQEVNTLYILL